MGVVLRFYARVSQKLGRDTCVYLCGSLFCDGSYFHYFQMEGSCKKKKNNSYILFLYGDVRSVDDLAAVGGGLQDQGGFPGPLHIDGS